MRRSKEIRVPFVHCPMSTPAKAPAFTRYQVFLIAVLAFIQFTVILDFMVMAPLGAILMPELKISAAQFSYVVLAYAISAGVAGFTAAAFADKFDRKKLLLFFYVGFIAGTLCCAMAPTYPLLLVARVVTGIFGGVIGSVAMAIVTDSFPPEKRGRVMGFLQMAFAASQVLGIPVGLYLAHIWSWHAPFYMIVVIGAVAGLVMWRFMRPVAEHLHLNRDIEPFDHLMRTVTDPRYRIAYSAMIVLATGGFLMMPFGTKFLVGNVKMTEAQLPTIFLVTGLCSMVIFPLVGRWSDKIGRLRTFAIGTAIALVSILIYCHLGPSPMSTVLILNAVMFLGIGSRIVSSSALMTSMPDLRDRGAFMSITSSIQMASGAVAAGLAGLIVVDGPDGSLLHYDMLGYVCCAAMVVATILIARVDRLVKAKGGPGVHKAPPVPAETV